MSNKLNRICKIVVEKLINILGIFFCKVRVLKKWLINFGGYFFSVFFKFKCGMWKVNFIVDWVKIWCCSVFVIISCIILRIFVRVVFMVMIMIKIISEVEMVFFVIKLMIVCIFRGRDRVISLVNMVYM